MFGLKAGDPPTLGRYFVPPPDSDVAKLGGREKFPPLGMGCLIAVHSFLEKDHYRLQMPGGKVIERDIVEGPESVLALPVGQKDNVILIEEYDLGAGAWQLTLPGGKVIDSSPEGIWQ